MTNYVNSIQPFEITIASGATTGTATLGTAVTTAKAFILWGGEAVDDNGNGTVLAHDKARVALTSTTVVTATRNTSGTENAVKIRGFVVDGDATNLIDSVQYGTVTMAGTVGSATQAITAIDQTRSVIMHLGNTTTSTGTANNNAATRLSFASNSSVQVDRESTSASCTTGFCVIQFKASAIQSVQFFSQNLVTSHASDTLTLGTAVNTSNAVMIDAGTSSATSTWSAYSYQKRITGATQLTFNRQTTQTSSRTLNGFVLEFVAAVVQSRQAGQTTANSVTSQQQSITAIDPAAAVVFSGGFSTNAANLQEGMSSVKLVGVSHIEVDKGIAGTTLSTHAWEVFEFSGITGSIKVNPTGNSGTLALGTVTIDTGPNTEADPTGNSATFSLGQVVASTPSGTGAGNWEDITTVNWEGWAPTPWEQLGFVGGTDVSTNVTGFGMVAAIGQAPVQTTISVGIAAAVGGFQMNALFGGALAVVDLPVDKGATNAERTYIVPPPLNNKTFTVLVA